MRADIVWYNSRLTPRDDPDLPFEKEAGMPTVHSKEDVALMAHLLRRAGFGATLEELDHCLEQGYEATVEALLTPSA